MPISLLLKVAPFIKIMIRRFKKFSSKFGNIEILSECNIKAKNLIILTPQSVNSINRLEQFSVDKETKKNSGPDLIWLHTIDLAYSTQFKFSLAFTKSVSCQILWIESPWHQSEQSLWNYWCWKFSRKKNFMELTQVQQKRIWLVQNAIS